MKIGIDTFGCDHGRSGVGTYLTSLCAHLPESRAGTDGGFAFELFGPEMDRYTYNSETALRYEGVSVPDTLVHERLWHIFRARAFVKKARYDCVFFPAGSRTLARVKSVPSVAVVHDVVSSLVKKRGGPWFSVQILDGLKRAAKVVASSQFVRKDLIALGVDSRKIEVVYNGIDHARFYPRPSVETDVIDIKPFAVKRPYFIYASSISGPEKRHVELIQAFDLFKLNSGFPHRLVLAGNIGKGIEAVKRAAAGARFSSDIFITGHFPHENLPQLYAASDACVFPASDEGAALPVAEAMAMGIPCAVAKSGVLPEIAGNNALYFSPDDTVDIALALQKIVTDEAFRAEVRASGIEWTKRFTWDKTVRLTLEAVRNAVSQFPPP
jgi:glycosyltransferase involved in cell wall biosynthesis